MREVWKYEVPVNDYAHDIDIPLEARLLHVDVQRPDRVAVWYEVDLEELGDTRPRPRTFRVFGTGHPISGEWNYVGTAMWNDAQIGTLVWHLYEEET